MRLLLQRTSVLLLVLIFQVNLHTSESFRFRMAPNLQSTPGLSASTTKSDSAKDDDAPHERKELVVLVSTKWARILYITSALNPFLAVFFNDYSRMLEPFPSIQTQRTNIVSKTMMGVFSVIRLRPRVSFAVGALLRALQLNTPFQYVINPPVGVGFGLNAICLMANSRWPATIFLGWSMTEPLWKMLGSRVPSSSPVPITINFNSSKKKKGADTKVDDDGHYQRPATDPGYQIEV